MAGGRSSRDEDLGPLHARGPKIIDGDFTVVHGPLPVQQAESDAFLAGLSMGPKYRPRREMLHPDLRWTRTKVLRAVIWGPPFAYMAVMGLVGLYQALTAHPH